MTITYRGDEVPCSWPGCRAPALPVDPPEDLSPDAPEYDLCDDHRDVVVPEVRIGDSAIGALWAAIDDRITPEPDRRERRGRGYSNVWDDVPAWTAVHLLAELDYFRDTFGVTPELRDECRACGTTADRIRDQLKSGDTREQEADR